MRLTPLLSCLSFCVLISIARAEDTPAPAPTTSPAEPPATQMVLELSDGSRIIGTPAIERLKVIAQYATMDIPLPQLRTVEFASATDRTAHVSLQNGDVLNVQLSPREITVKTIFGNVVIPLVLVRKIRVSATGGAAMPEGLVLHYTFDKDEGDRVTDKSSAGNNGKVNGATYTSEGKTGGAMSFSGNRQAVVIASPVNLQFQDFTIMAWIKRGDANKVSKDMDDGLLFGFGHNGYVMAIDAEGHAALSKCDVDKVLSSCAIHDDAFHHIAVTKQGSHVVFYLDGIAYPASDYDRSFEFGTDAAVGSRADTLSNCFLGVIGEVLVFNHPLSGDEIKNLYDSQK